MTSNACCALSVASMVETHTYERYAVMLLLFGLAGGLGCGVPESHTS